MRSTVPILVNRFAKGQVASSSDQLAIEEPLEIRLSYVEKGKRLEKTIAITMRTPGDDADLAAGFLFTEGIVQSKRQIRSIELCGKPAKPQGPRNVVKVTLTDDVAIDLGRLERHFYTSSSCGVCGKTSIEALTVAGAAKLEASGWRIPAAVIQRLPASLRAAQPLFDRTGGLHASALFTLSGELVTTREDVGRHNALDKLIGAHMRNDDLPLSDRGVMVSGRASFELVQKAVMAGIPVMAAVGAPSSLAVELADRFSMTLIGFVRDDRFNVYAGAERVDLVPLSPLRS